MYGGKYGLIRYGIGKIDAEFEVRAYFLASLKNALSVGENIMFDLSGYANFDNLTTITRGLPLSEAFADGLQAAVSVVGAIPVQASFEYELGSRLHLSEDINIPLDAREALAGKAYLSKDIYFAFSAEEDLKHGSWLSKDIGFAVTASEILSAAISVYTLENQIVSLHVTLPPGGRLYIDSENFNVLQNGENVLHLHEGDWITIDRDTIRLSLDSGTGGELKGQLLYTERFL